jgi:hypothetical protein
LWFGLEGVELYFADARLGGPVDKKAGNLLQEKVSTGSEGQAGMTWQFPRGEQPASFVVRYRGDRHRPSSYDVARAFTWPARTDILLVEARHGLMNASDAVFHKRNIFALQPLPGSEAALKATRAKHYRIVYLATAPAEPADYRKLRGWLQRRLPPADALVPDGPALGRADYSEQTDLAASQRAVIRTLRTTFHGKLVGVVRQEKDAQVFRAAGLKTIVVGGKSQGKGWNQVPALLP